MTAGLAPHDISIKKRGVITETGSFDYHDFDQISFDAGQAFMYTIKRENASHQIKRKSQTSFEIVMRLVN